MKLFILITGLALLVPRGPVEDSFQSVEVLFLDSEGRSDTCGTLFPEHQIVARYWEMMGNGRRMLVERDFSTKPLSIEIEGLPSGEVTRDPSWDNAFHLEDILSSPVVKSDCLSEKNLDECTDTNGKGLLTGRLVLRGGRLGALEVSPANSALRRNGAQIVKAPRWIFEKVPQSGSLQTGKFVTNHPWCFSELGSNCSGSSHSTRLYNGILFEIDIDDIAPTNAEAPRTSVTIQFGEEAVVLQPVSTDQCTDLGSNPCMILQIDAEPNAMLPQNCSRRPLPGEFCREDSHFQMSYRLMESPVGSEDQLVPGLCRQRADWPIRTLLPSAPSFSRCIPPVANAPI